MKLIILIKLLFFVSFNCFAVDYYIKAKGGTGAGTSDATAWSLAHLNASWSKVKAGDRIYFKKGDIFYGTISVGSSGTALKRITISNYGTGNLPIITGFETITAWEAKDGYNIVTSKNAVTALTSARMVLYNGKFQPKGRFPKAYATNKGWKTWTNRTSTSITDNKLSKSPSWVGAEAVIRTRHDRIDKSMVTKHSSTELSLGSGVDVSDNRIGFGYFLQGHIEAIRVKGTIEGEWYWNEATKKISVYAGSRTIGTVKVANINNLMTFGGKSYITITGLRFEGSNERMINLGSGENTSNIKFQDCEFQYAGESLFFGGATNNIQIIDCVLKDAGSYGIFGEYSCNTWTVRGNLVQNIYLYPGHTRNGFGGYGIYISELLGKNQHTATSSAQLNLVEKNRVISNGAGGIRLEGSHYLIQQNFVYNYSFTKDDVGGIYDANPGSIVANRIIQDNIIDYSKGAKEGTPDKSWNAGLYLDDEANNIILRRNIITRNDEEGLFIQRANNVVVENNVVFNNKQNLRISYSPLRSSTSSTNVSIPTTHPSTRIFTIAANVGYWKEGEEVMVVAYNTSYFNATVTSYNSATGELVLRSSSHLGSGTFSSWRVHRKREMVHNLTLRGNIFFSKLPTEYTAWFQTSLDEADIQRFGTFNNNYYARPVAGANPAHIRTVVAGSGTDRTLSGWKKLSLQDEKSLPSPATVSGGYHIIFHYNDSLVSNKIIHLPSGIWTSMKGVNYSGKIHLAPFTYILVVCRK